MTGASIFLVEDEALIRLMLADMIEDLGHRVVAEAGNIKVGQALAQAAIFDLAVLDINIAGYSISSVAEIIDARLREDVPTVLVSLHSFTPVYAGIARPWHIGTLYQRDTRLPQLLLKLLRGEGDLVVGDNEPYAVSDETDYTIPVHGEARGLMNTGIEIRQDLIADQAGQQQWADRLARIFGEVETTLRAQRLI